ncbi:hypothetical protein MOBT1_000752 [Malassezia obtusa]|uniref:F-box domain-containing protein n=1 Tax=Malassezia obtusa TaxID=76774 RepID=A0AAF0ISD9_9BASI|nr:hypothetical protein MOBT1_000752 [Malassezia obtusa]
MLPAVCALAAGAALLVARRARRTSAAARAAPWCAALPPELRLYILACAVRQASLTPAAGDTLTPLLTLSRAHWRALAPAAYHTVRVCSPRALHRLRRTLVVLRPELGTYVHTIALEGLAESAALGLEHLALAVPRLAHLALDAPSAAALCRSPAARLRTGAKPHTLSLVLPSSEAALDVSGALLMSALGAHVHTLCVVATPAAARTLAPRLVELRALRRVDVRVCGCDAPRQAVRDAFARVQAHNIALDLAFAPRDVAA